MIAFGAPQEMLDALPKPPSTFEVFPENWPAVEMFLKICTQWRTQFNGVRIVYTGVDYNVFPFLFTISKTKNRAELFEDLQTMELAARSVLNGG